MTEVFPSGADRTTLGLRRRTGDLAAFAGVQEVVLKNGREEGVRALVLRNASGLEIEVLIDRAFDLGGARYRGAPFGWRSGNGFRHPGLHEADAEDGLSWLRALDGLLVTGGLDHALFGGEYDATHYNYPPKQTVRHGLHGRLTAIPARLLRVEEHWDETGGVLRVVGEVVQATSFGEHLRLTRTIEVDVFGTEVRVHDVVDNLGFEPTPHMFLYHLNIGYPFVDEGTSFVADVDGHEWASDSTSQQGVAFDRLSAPIDGFVEQVWEHRLRAGVDGWHRVALHAPGGERGIEVAWDAATQPYFFEWQNLRSGQYGVGLEPSSNHVSGEAAAREDGSLVWLGHGESRTYRMTISILDGADEIAQSADRIRGH
ncbi:aldose 1-epimerase family protein [Microbacterium fluvii]|uniref:Aldose 1-epimerase family protein n=1 Tax=Microbacterium fluvii TaxID=415215 RepID=A0ABW2HE80_9MICO|nr:aldose 1-epimerase family protein [Microbacterium fluvii]MCU4673070.1 aldose 1-epimerase family protein [Microbacterium fluvii]